MTTATTSLVHATAVVLTGRGVLILGPSGAGKSDLALRMITTPLLHCSEPVDVRLVSDDQVLIEREGDRLFASPPATIAGLLEVRGLGIVQVPFVPRAEIHLAIVLKSAEDIERLPVSGQTHPILGLNIPLIAIDGAKPGAPARLVLAALGTLRSER
ncbi:MAG: HPr kinase/phosphorylase [Hyphomicrobiaceae bacterium]